MKCRSGRCKGVIEPKVVHSHKGYLITQEESCSTCNQRFFLKPGEKEKFEKQVDLFDEIAAEDLETWMDKADARKASKIRCEEIISQAVLKKIMPGRDLIKIDIGNRDSQYDLLSKMDRHTIAIEITQAINQNALESESFLKHSNHIFELKRSRYQWIMGINKTMKLSNKNKLLKIEDLLIEIEKHHIASNILGRIESSLYRYNQLTAVEQLEKLGVICFSGEPATSGIGSVNIQGPVDGSSLDIKYLLRVINQHACKADNIKKLELAHTDERHIFIPITAFESGAAYYLQYMPQVQRLPLQVALDTLGVTCFIPDIIDVVWVVTFMNFTSDKKLGFLLAKVTREGGDLVIENASNGIVPYRA